MADKTDAPRQPTESELRETVMRGEALRQQLAALEQQRDLLADLLGEARRANLALDHLAGAKEGDEVLVPLGAGAFVHAKLAQEGKAISALGSGVHAETDTGAARDRMRARVQSLETTAGQLNKDLARVADELTTINAVLEQYYGGA